MTTGWLLVLTLFASSQQPPQQPRDSARPPGAIATIRGVVTAAATGRPLHRVRVTLNGQAQNPPTAVTDTRGEFELVDVPPGSYTLTATRAGYLTIQYGQRRPREAGRTIEVKPGETINGIAMALPRGGVLAGRITDEAGDPAPAVRVEALEHRYIRGHRVLVPGRITSTNDAGEFRLSGLEPGSFQIRASSREVWESDDGKMTYVFAMTYFPGVVGADQPQAITVNLGQEVNGLDFRLIPGRAARLTGVVEDANGQPLRDQQVHLSDITRGIGGRLVSSGRGADPVRTDARGAFEFNGLAPGEYLALAGGAEDRVSVTVVLGDGDSQHVVLSPRRPSEVAGTIVTDDGTPAPFLPSRLRVTPTPTDPQRVLPLWNESSTVTVRPDWTFRARNLEGPHLLRVEGLPDGWMLASVRIGGREMVDTPLATTRGGPDVQGVELVLSQRGARLAGDVASERGASAADCTVIVFAEDSTRWGPGSRFVRAVRPGDDGRYAVAGLPPGVYRVVARDFVQDGQWEDASFLERLRRGAVRVELSAGTAETVHLKVEQER